MAEPTLFPDLDFVLGDVLAAEGAGRPLPAAPPPEAIAT